MKQPGNYFLLTGFFLLSCISLSSQDLGELDLDKLDKYVEKARQEWQVPGLSIALVKNDTVVFARGYGLKEYGKAGEVDKNTIFSIASLTKGFTSAALGMLDDEENLEWDDPVRKYLPGFTLYDPMVSDEIRIRDLLCHRSGFKTFSGDLLWMETDYSREEILQRIEFLIPAYGFRYQFGYSNLMFLVAGELIPAVSDMSWDEFIKSRILDPLGMNRTFLRLEKFDDDPNVAMPHHVNLMSEKTQVLPYWNLQNIAPAMGLNSSAMDMTLWLRFQLNMGFWNGEQLVSNENLWESRKMHTAQAPELGENRIWPSRHFAGYGLGWNLYDYHGWKVLNHEGGTDGMMSRVVLVPEENLGFIILTNSINALTIALEYYILDQYYQGKSYDWSAIYLKNSIIGLDYVRKEWDAYLESADRTIKPSKKLREYSGSYGGDLYGNVEVRHEKGQLVIDFLPTVGKMIGDLKPFSQDTFLIQLRKMPAMPQGTVKFILDDTGEVSELLVDIPSPDFDFTELKLLKQ